MANNIKVVKVMNVRPINLTSLTYTGQAIIDLGENGGSRTVDFVARFNRLYFPYSQRFDSMPEYPNNTLNGNQGFVSPVLMVRPSSYGDELASKIRKHFNEQARNQYESNGQY